MTTTTAFTENESKRARSSRRAKVNLAILSIVLVWTSSLQACEQISSGMFGQSENARNRNGDEKEFDRMVRKWERVASSAREQRQKHERCVKRTIDKCARALESELKREEELAKIGMAENERKVEILDALRSKCESEVDDLAYALRSQKRFFDDYNMTTSTSSSSSSSLYADTVKEILSENQCVFVDGNDDNNKAVLGQTIERKLDTNAEETTVQISQDLENVKDRYSFSAEESIKSALTLLEARQKYDRAYLTNKTGVFSNAKLLHIPNIQSVSIGNISTSLNVSLDDINAMAESFASAASASMNETSALISETSNMANTMYREAAESAAEQIDILELQYETVSASLSSWFAWYSSTISEMLDVLKTLSPGSIGSFGVFQSPPDYALSFDDINFPTEGLQGLSEQSKRLREKVESEAHELVSNFSTESRRAVSKASKELNDKINDTFVSATENIAEQLEKATAFEDYNPPKLLGNETEGGEFDNHKNEKEEDAFIEAQLRLSQTRKRAFDRDTADILKRLDDEKNTNYAASNFSATAEQIRNTSRYEEFFSTSLDETSNNDFEFNIFAPLGFKAPGATLRNALENLKKAKKAVVHADVAYRIVRTIQVLSQHWHSNAFVLDPIEMKPSQQHYDSNNIKNDVDTIEDGRNDMYNNKNRKGGDLKKLSTLEMIAKFFSDPVHVAAMKLGMVLFVAAVMWSAYYPILQAHSKKCSKSTFLDDIVLLREDEDFKSASSFIARNAYSSARDYVHISPNTTAEFNKKQLLSSKTNSIRSHAVSASSAIQALLAKADSIESSFRLVTAKEKEAFDTCLPEHALMTKFINVSSSSSSSTTTTTTTQVALNNDTILYYKNEETLAKRALAETSETIENILILRNNESNHFLNEKIFMDSLSINVPCLAVKNEHALLCKGVREAPLRFEAKLAACETETFLHRSFLGIFLSLFIFISLNATRKTFIESLGKIFWRASFVSSRDALRCTSRVDALNETYEKMEEQNMKTQIKDHCKRQERKGFMFAVACVLLQLPWFVLVVVSSRTLLAAL